MKRIFTISALILALTLSMISPAFAVDDKFEHAAPSGITAAGNGSYLLTDVFNKVVWNISADGTHTRIAGQINVSDVSGEPVGAVTDGTLLTALFENPWAIAPFLDGYVISEPDANVIRYIDAKSVQTAAGSGEEGAKDGNGTAASFSFPTGLAAGGSGEVYIADTGNGSIRCLATNGAVTTVFTGLADPTGICWYQGALYVAETGAHCISKIENGVRTVVVGAAGEDGYTDGYVKAARLRDPQGVALDNDGTIYIADTGNHAVRCLRGDQVSTLAYGDSVGMPRGILVREGSILVTDPFSRSVITLSTVQAKFSDIKDGAWYESAVYDSVRRGLFRGVGDNLFDPNGLTNRAMLAQMLANLQQQLDRDVILAGEAALSDVSEGQWYATVAVWAVGNGFMDVKSGEFAPLREISREEMTLALFRYASSIGVDTSARTDLTAFRDADRVTDGAKDAMSWAIATGLIRGVGENTISPDTTTTRAQMVQVMIRF
ncbi:MAG: S-layer homology domain-containing protein, partial [Oscillospiraceae bacterium]|nr:S-layer homology domain-containing protein [Oscillospiraceae bacterium]